MGFKDLADISLRLAWNRYGPSGTGLDLAERWANELTVRGPARKSYAYLPNEKNVISQDYKATKLDLITREDFFPKVT